MKIIQRLLTLIFVAFLLFSTLQKVFAYDKSIFVAKNSLLIDTNIRYDIAISEKDIASAQSLNPSCVITSWTLNTGYGGDDSKAANFESLGSTSNAIKPIAKVQNVFSEQNGFDVLHSNGFDRVMLSISFFGENESCEIKYPIVTKPILFSEFPFNYPSSTIQNQ